MSIINQYWGYNTFSAGTKYTCSNCEKETICIFNENVPYLNVNYKMHYLCTTCDPKINKLEYTLKTMQTAEQVESNKIQLIISKIMEHEHTQKRLIEQNKQIVNNIAELRKQRDSNMSLFSTEENKMKEKLNQLKKAIDDETANLAKIQSMKINFVKEISEDVQKIYQNVNNPPKENNEKLSCSVCMNNNIEVSIFCGHTYCQVCCNGLKDICAICRKQSNGDFGVRKIYFS